MPKDKRVKTASSNREPASYPVDDLLESPTPPSNPDEGEQHAIGESEIGSELEIRELYRNDRSKPWTKWKAGEDPSITKHPESLKYALVVRRERNKELDEGLLLHSVTVQSPILREMLSKVFDGYQGLSTKTKNLTFQAPFHDFVHCWDAYAATKKLSEADETQRRVMELFSSVLEPEIQPLLDRKQDVLRERQAEHADVWTIFTPGLEICNGIGAECAVYQLVSSRYGWDMLQGANCLSLTCRNIDYIGFVFGWQPITLSIAHYEGVESLDKLDVIPLKLHTQESSVVTATTTRGKKFVSLQGWHYKSYTGLVTPANSQRRPRRIESGRVVIDAALFSNQNGGNIGALTSLNDILPPPPPLLYGDPFIYDPAMPFPPPPPPPPPLFPAPPPPSTRPPRKLNDTEAEIVDYQHFTLADEQYRLCTSVVKGYDMTSKQWASFSVDGIHEIKFSTAAFKRLVLPHDYKELILAFVDGHLNQEDEFDDIIKGKGKGMIVLLHGAPGLGKTLTAEAVAEEMQVPLYSMSAGQLGFDVETMETALQDVLDICAKWGAVLLLDEADVFLEQRQLTDLQRNRLVSIFLRMLEYYQGCLFLTTNRVSAFDLAFKSRIDLAITYPSLDFAARRHIWQTFVRASEEFPLNGSSITDDELFDLAELELNGREVKNLVKTGRLLARRQGEVLAMRHLVNVVSVQRELPGDGSGLVWAVPGWVQGLVGRVVVQMVMRVRRGISFG